MVGIPKLGENQFYSWRETFLSGRTGRRSLNPELVTYSGDPLMPRIHINLCSSQAPPRWCTRTFISLLFTSFRFLILRTASSLALQWLTRSPSKFSLQTLRPVVWYAHNASSSIPYITAPPTQYMIPTHTHHPHVPGNVHMVSPAQIRAEQPQRKRPKYTRSKTGCLTCRAKKIKVRDTALFAEPPT